MFLVTWYNPQKYIYDYFYIPNNYLAITKARLINNYDLSDYIDVEISLAQLYNYRNGFNLVNNIFNEVTSDWIKNVTTNTNFTKYKHIAAKVSIK